MTKKIIQTTLLVASISLLSGCVQRAPILESHFGQSVTLLRAQQVINPQASASANPAVGLDGRAAKSAYENYQKSFKAQEAQPGAFTIGVGTGK